MGGVSPLLLRMRDTHTAHTNYTSSIIDTCIDQDTLYYIGTSVGGVV